MGHTPSISGLLLPVHGPHRVGVDLGRLVISRLDRILINGHDVSGLHLGIQRWSVYASSFHI